MRDEIVEAYRGYGIKPENIKSVVTQAFETLEAPRKVLVGLEIEHRKRLIAQQGKCARCPRTDMLTIDHVIPRAILAVMGVDVDELSSRKT